MKRRGGNSSRHFRVLIGDNPQSERLGLNAKLKLTELNVGRTVGTDLWV